MDKNKMLEKLKSHLESVPTDQLIKDLMEYDIKVVSYVPGSMGSVAILDDEESHIP